MEYAHHTDCKYSSRPVVDGLTRVSLSSLHLTPQLHSGMMSVVCAAVSCVDRNGGVGMFNTMSTEWGALTVEGLHLPEFSPMQCRGEPTLRVDSM